jgi:microsomal epoxide hydrolase/non-specific protein-tyrosine kinase
MTQAPLNGAGWPDAHRVDANGVTLSVHEAGPISNRPPLVFCHGWPELAFSWRHQVEALSALGWRCLALDMRGYGASSAPSAIEAYAMTALCGDLVGLLDAKGIDQAVFVGHDWGGLVVWDMARRHPDRVCGVVGVCTPHRKRLPFDPIAGMKARWGDDFYIVYFQQPGPAETLFEADLDKTFRFLQRTGPQVRAAAAAAPKLPFLALQLQLQAVDAAPDAPTLLSPQDRAVYVDAYRQSGFRGGLNWYRNFSRNWADSATLPDTVSQPALMILAEWDAALPPSAADGMEEIVPHLEKRLIPQTGHWVQQEAPGPVNAAIADWLARTFPG